MPHIDTHLDAIAPMVKQAAQQSPMLVRKFASQIAQKSRMSKVHKFKLPMTLMAVASIQTPETNLAHRIIELSSGYVRLEPITMSQRLELLCLVGTMGITPRTPVDVCAILQQYSEDMRVLDERRPGSWATLLKALKSKLSQIHRRAEGLGLKQRLLALPVFDQSFFISMAAWCGEERYRAGYPVWELMINHGGKKWMYSLDLEYVEPILQALERGAPVRALEQIKDLFDVHSVVGVSKVFVQSQGSNQAQLLGLMESGGTAQDHRELASLWQSLLNNAISH